MTLIPFCSDSATFSAACRHTAQFRNIASPSRHSLVWRSNVRGVDATVKFATAAPEGVKRSSGSAVRLPTNVIVVSPAMKISVVMSVDGIFCCPRGLELNESSSLRRALSACQPILTLRAREGENVDNLADLSADQAG